jgi:hypothetical protein
MSANGSVCWRSEGAGFVKGTAGMFGVTSADGPGGHDA